MGFKHKNSVHHSHSMLHLVPVFRDPSDPFDVIFVKHRKTSDEIWEKADYRIPYTGSTFTSPVPGNSPVMQSSRLTDDHSAEDNVRTKFPILSPNRQQVKMHQEKARRLNKRQNVVPLDGPGRSLSIGGPVGSGEMAVFDDQAANAVMFEAEAQIKSGYPTIATSTMVHNKRQRHPSFQDDILDNETDIKFLSELVKPIQYRWKFQNDRLKTITPSKHGFHPRSKSPTFKRLIEATEKLQVMSEDGDTDELSERYERDFVDAETQVESVPVFEKTTVIRNAKTEPTNSKRESITNSLPPTLEPTFSISPIKPEFKPEVRAFEAIRADKEITYWNDDSFDDAASVQSREDEVTRIQTVKEFKVDFKRTESHSELHLFLPHIHDAMSRGTTPEYKQSKPIPNTRSLPSIPDATENKTEEKSRTRVRRRNGKTKRTRSQVRTKMGGDDKVFRDVLNDVPTLISMEKEKVEGFHPASMCVFEHCQQHHHRKSTGLRQP